MKNLDWFQARKIAQLERRPIRRESWRKWLAHRAATLWEIYSPGDDKLDPPAPAIPRRVALNSDFASEEFLAHDWTEEDWNKPPVVDPPGDGGTNPGGGDSTGNPGSGGSGDDGSGDDTGTGTDPGTDPTGGGWGNPGNPPGPGGTGDPGTDPGGGGTGGGGGGTGDDPNTPPDTGDPNNPSNYDYKPTVTVTLSPGADGPGCWINTTLVHGKAHVTVTIPDPAGGPLKAGTISVGNGAGNKLGSMGPGASQSFEFDVSVNPGAKVTYSATFSGGTGKTWTGTGSATWEPSCIIYGANWGGSRTTTHRCNPPPDSTGDPPENGYDETDVYSTGAQYAINPEPGTKSGNRTPVNVGPYENRTVTNTPYPSGSPTVTKSHVEPPGSITVTVAANRAVSNVLPQKLNILSSAGDGTTTEGECTTTITSSETGPS